MLEHKECKQVEQDAAQNDSSKISTDIEAYIAALADNRRQKIIDIVSYMHEHYPALIGDCAFSPKTRFPVFKTPDGRNYVGIASQKQYIAIHFGRYSCPAIVAAADKRIKTGVGCAKIPDSVPFPYEQIKRAIDVCFEEV
jgi:pyruvate/2-oxoacid:ferredoxin oxidoreductase alpha subunit